MAPQQLACPKCGCLLAQFDTEVRRECPGCGLAFTAEAPPVLPSEVPKEDRVDSAAAGCGMIILLFLLSGLVPSNMFDLALLQLGAVALLIGTYFYLRHVRHWSEKRAVHIMAVSLFVLFLATLFATLLLPFLFTTLSDSGGNLVCALTQLPGDPSLR